jgi:hypothetical protein
VAAAWLSALSQGHLDKARRAGSAAYDLALSCLGTALYDSTAQQLGVEDAEAGPAGGQPRSDADKLLAAVQGREAAPASGGHRLPGGAAAQRARLAVSAVQQLPPVVLHALMQVGGRLLGACQSLIVRDAAACTTACNHFDLISVCAQAVQARGLGMREQCQFLAQACEGDAAAEERLRRVLLEAELL